MDSPAKRKYATCILSVLEPSSVPLPTRIIAHRGDALCLLDGGVHSHSTLGGRRIDFSGINLKMILDWVQACQDRHDASCLPMATEELGKVRLIDVETRTIVRYPGFDCEYIALSYVWGDVVQSTYRLGDVIQSLPRTLEDALSLTRKLGKRYMWIDSVCIDQSDDEDKSEQINRMWSIYKGAWVTVIALSGSSADAGLPRFSRQQHHPQLSSYIEGKAIVSLMPTLSQQIWMSPWGQRAWTLQEGLLSPRCLYISDHQIYYDCSSMQCCESLDDSRSWAHHLTPASNPTQEGFVTWMLRQAGAGALRIPLDWPSRRLEHWGEKLNLYSYRLMTYPEDAIRAFLGVLQRLETIYPEGFFEGLPVEDFDWALTWASQTPPSRRQGFPSWSWAGWLGPLFFGQPVDVKKTRRLATDLDIRACRAGELREVFVTRGNGNIGGSDIKLVILHDPVDRAALQEPEEAEFDLKKHPSAEQDRYLFITAICFHFTPDFSNPRTGTYASGQNETFLITIRNTPCLIRIFSTDRHIQGRWDQGRWVAEEYQEKQTFMLLARDHLEGFILHKLMLLKMGTSSIVAERATVLELLVPLDELDVLEEYSPKRRRIVLT
ncbi:hypothetical protein PV08_07097 [Exophiala spinifera]|uniref:Heterokaryon incompatibility domain-containing protein n=1 Tax=Exophiala spinifera TaxID=91928 RepID=A0A0D2B6K7_9EURO|nr:uncharacterized protein PV08_07097 [Exophiala spinifera]KIW14315.1 hypothetical protein PV08_07097 [Exophiala spinifera]